MCDPFCALWAMYRWNSKGSSCSNGVRLAQLKFIDQPIIHDFDQNSSTPIPAIEIHQSMLLTGLSLLAT